MKWRKLIAGFSFCVLAMVSGCTNATGGQPPQKDIEDLQLEDLTLRLNQVDFTVYQPLASVLRDDGWTLNKEFAGKTVAPNEVVDVQIHNQGDSEHSQHVTVVNSTNKKVNIKDATISSLTYSFWNDTISCEMPNKIQQNATMDELLDLLGTPAEADGTVDDYTLSYERGMMYQEVFSFSFTDGKLVEVTVDGSKGNKETSNDKGFLTADNIEYEPFSLQGIPEGNNVQELVTGGMNIDGISLVKHTALTDFTANGWEITEAIIFEGSKESSVTLTKDDTNMYIVVDGVVTDQIANEANGINTLTLISEDGFPHLSLSGNITSQASAKDLMMAYGLPHFLSFYQSGYDISYGDGEGIMITFEYDQSDDLQLIQFDNGMMSVEVEEPFVLK